MAESPFDAPSDPAKPEQQRSRESARLQLRMHHLFALTAVMAVLLAIAGPQRSFGGQEFEGPPLVRTIQLVFGVLHQILAAVAVTALAYGIVWYRQGLPFFNQPGHWILVEISLVTLLSIPPSLIYRSISFSPQMAPGDIQMTLIMIAGVYGLLFLFLGRAVINVYLGMTRCVERRWRFVFFAKALASIVFGLGDILVIALAVTAMRADRREQIPRDASHRCGVLLQVALSAMIIISTIVGALSMYLLWPR